MNTKILLACSAIAIGSCASAYAAPMSKPEAALMFAGVSFYNALCDGVTPRHNVDDNAMLVTELIAGTKRSDPGIQAERNHAIASVLSLMTTPVDQRLKVCQSINSMLGDVDKVISAFN